MNKIHRSIKISPLFLALSDSLIFITTIDTLYLTLTKGLTASQINTLTIIALLISILFKKYALSIAKKIGNVNSAKLGAFLLLISAIFLLTGKSFIAMAIYYTLYQVSYIFINMSIVLLKNNLISINQADDFFKIRNKAKILYSLLTIVTTFISGILFSINPYLPVFLTIITCIFNLLLSFGFYEDNNTVETTCIQNIDNTLKSAKIGLIPILIILYNALFYSCLQLGQRNGKIFMQYELQKILTINFATIYVTRIIFISRITRTFGNIIFEKIYSKMQNKLSLILNILLCSAYIFLIIGFFISKYLMLKVFFISFGFLMIVTIKDSFQIFIEQIALYITDKCEYQKIILNIEIYKKFATLIISTIITLVLLKYDLIIIQFIFLFISIVCMIMNFKLTKHINKINNN